MSLREELEKTLRINLGLLHSTYLGTLRSTWLDEFITNTVDDLMADLTIHGLIKE